MLDCCSSVAHCSISSSSQDLLSQSEAAHFTTDSGDNLMDRESEYSSPEDPRLDSLMKEAEHVRDIKTKKQAALDNKFVDFN